MICGMAELLDDNVHNSLGTLILILEVKRGTQKHMLTAQDHKVVNERMSLTQW